jgi:hypothetical protein
MKIKKLNVRLVKLPDSVELTLYFIREELKATRVYNGLAQTGFESCAFETHFSTLILAYMGFDSEDDSLYEFLIKLIDKYSAKISTDNDSIMKYTLKVYVALLNEKRRRAEASAVRE